MELKEVIKTLTVHYFVFLLLSSFITNVYSVHLNQFAVEVHGGQDIADHIAEELGFTNTGQIGSLKNYYLFVHHGIEKRSTTPSHDHPHVQALHSHPEVKYAEQQFAKKREKRGYLASNLAEDNHRGASSILTNYDPRFNDSLYKDQWYLHKGANEQGDMGVLAAWQKGYTGRDIVVTILDDGLERTHKDIAENYDPRASYDINGGDYDPTPRYDVNDENRHGTRCAGEVAASANNSECGVGIAYHARIGGVRMLDGDVSDAVEAQSLSLNPDHIDIYSASWGPDDNGKVVDGPSRLAWQAFKDGVQKGRRGLGSIFVWASGNGGSDDDSCNCDGYTNSIYTLSISSVSERNRKPWYLEECSSTLASTYSSGASYVEKQIVTTDIRNRCTMTHTGTSASAPLAAGICALALEANPTLTWRDMQYITVMTADPYHVRNDGEWVTNGMGRKVSLRYGYGIMDAGAMVSLAERWTTVPEQHICTSGVQDEGKPITGRRTSFPTVSNGCSNGQQEVRFLEHVQVIISLQYSHRGNLRIHLVSPRGTQSTLLPKRRQDFSRGSFNNWPFMSVHFWGENPVGKWTLILENLDSSSDLGTLGGWDLVLYGTAAKPVNVRDPVRKSTAPRRPDIVCDKECPNSCRGPKPEDCLKCTHFRRGVEGPCVHECEEKEFADPVTRLCIQCHPSCLTCQGPEENDCIDCKDGIYLVQSLGTCLGHCPDGYYSDEKLWMCRQCRYPCLTCSGAENQCQSCPQGLTLSSEGQCLHNCLTEGSQATYLTDNGNCAPCHNSCQACSGPTSRDCLSCPSPQVLHSGLCLTTCPPKYFKHGDGHCLSCYRTCDTCKDEGPKDCETCADGYSLYQGHCITSAACSEGLYFEQNSRSCGLCHHSCKTCDGPEYNECTSCPSDHAYNARQRQCTPCCVELTNCPVGRFLCSEQTVLSAVPQAFSPDKFNRKFEVLSVIWCLASIILFFVIFAVLQARSEGLFCFKKEISYQALDALYNDRIMLADDDFTDEEDIFVADNEKGSVKFVPNSNENTAMLR